MSVEQIKEQIKEELSKHDFYFEWSDDISIWRRGKDHRDKIIGMAQENRIELEDFIDLVTEKIKDKNVIDMWVVLYGTVRG